MNNETVYKIIRERAILGLLNKGFVDGLPLTVFVAELPLRLVKCCREVPNRSSSSGW